MANIIQNERLKLLLEAEKKILQSQRYTIGNRTNERAKLSEVQKEISDLIAGGATVDGMEMAAGSRAKRIVLRDW